MREDELKSITMKKAIKNKKKSSNILEKKVKNWAILSLQGPFKSEQHLVILTKLQLGIQLNTQEERFEWGIEECSRQAHFYKNQY